MDEKKAPEDGHIHSPVGGQAEHSHDPVVDKDGMRIHPQPTTDALDPLNWSTFRKHSILAVVMLKYFLFTYITTTT
ncbi:hypothetical protein LTR66_017552, partial [Elasticomyces elasticus]